MVNSKKTIGLDWQKKQLRTFIMLLICTFLSHCCTAATWDFIISRACFIFIHLFNFVYSTLLVTLKRKNRLYTWYVQYIVINNRDLNTLISVHREERDQKEKIVYILCMQTKILLEKKVYGSPLYGVGEHNTKMFLFLF